MNIYLSGIGGVGIGALADIAESAGYTIFGSDSNNSMMVEKLKKKNIDIEIGNQDGSFLKTKFIENGVDWFVYTAALPKDHPEIKMAKSLGIKITKRDELLNYIIEQKKLKLIAISGTHGKTTTTGMMIWVLKQLGVPVSWSIGTTLTFGDSGYFDPKSDFFVYEADEFDRNFLHFSPTISLITSIDHDHTDIYRTEKDYLDAFVQFARQSDFTVSWQDEHSEIFEDIHNKFILKDIDSNVVLAGTHNRKNATLVLEALEYLASIGYDFGENLYERTLKAINSFPGTVRRFEKIANGIYSDYGHHPVEVCSTLEMAQEVANKEGFKGVVLIYQPHQNVRQVEVQNEYTEDVFKFANKVIWLPTYLSREDPSLEILTPQFLAKNIKDKAIFSQLDSSLIDTIKEYQKNNYLVLAMSAGSLDGLIRSEFSK